MVQADRAHFYPTQDLIYLQLVTERKTRRLLGVQGLSHNGDALVGRINSIAALLPFKPGLEDLSNLEVAYAPPFAAALDIVNAVANTAENTLDGYNKNIDVAEFERCFLTEQAGDAICLDVRGAQNAAPYVDLFGERWLNIPQETLSRRVAEIPADKRLPFDFPETGRLSCRTHSRQGCFSLRVRATISGRMRATRRTWPGNAGQGAWSTDEPQPFPLPRTLLSTGRITQEGVA